MLRYTLRAPGFGVIDKTVWGFCPVCNASTVEIFTLPMTSLNVHLLAMCHGSKEYISIPYTEMVIENPCHLPAAVSEWLHNIFKNDTNPDVMLAIRYGRGLI
jgi:hypothetical protein